MHLIMGLPPREGSFDKNLERLNSRDDTADFSLPALLTVLAKHCTNTALETNQRQLIENAIINFKYWPDELEDVAGFSEWLSNVYYPEDMSALLALVDLAQDTELRSTEHSL